MQSDYFNYLIRIQSGRLIKCISGCSYQWAELWSLHDGLSINQEGWNFSLNWKNKCMYFNPKYLYIIGWFQGQTQLGLKTLQVRTDFHQKPVVRRTQSRNQSVFIEDKKVPSQYSLEKWARWLEKTSFLAQLQTSHTKHNLFAMSFIFTELYMQTNLSPSYYNLIWMIWMYLSIL